MHFFRFFRYLNFKVFRRVVRGIGEQRLIGLAAEMAYNNLLALFPLIVSILAAIGFLEISAEKVDFLARQLVSFAPEQVSSLMERFTDEVTLPRGRRVISISFAVALWVASGAISVAMNAMDQIYRIPMAQRRPFWRSKLIALLLTAGTITLVVSASFLIFISDFIVEFLLSITTLPEGELLSIWNFFRWTSGLVMLAFAFCLIYRFGPSRWRTGTPLLPGAAIAAFSWAAMSRLFRLYVANFAAYNLTYGTLSTGIVLMLWLNFSSLVMLVGAQLNVAVAEAMQEEQKWRRLRRES